MGAPIQQWTALDGINTRHLESGVGPSVVLIHGGDFRSNSTADDWQPLLARLAAHGFHSVAPDKLGQGFTDAPGADQQYTFTSVVEHMKRFVATLGDTALTLIGHSRGALVAAALAVDQPSNIDRLVLISSNSTSPEHDSARSEFYRAAYADRPEPPDRMYLAREPTMNSHDLSHIDSWFIDMRLQAARLPKSARVHARISDLYESLFLPDLISCKQRVVAAIGDGAIECPTLIVWGRQDRSAPTELAWSLLSCFGPQTATADLVIVDRTGHYPFRERPDLTAGLVSAFLAAGGRHLARHSGSSSYEEPSDDPPGS